ncbi:MAG TPA: ribosome maturation factor RimP [Epsilonproteobacteria bacterium]|nr:ribosome maturation factor RimP [Campylobacterota bacterium]
MHKDDIEKIVTAHGASLYDTEVTKEFNETIYRVYVTQEGGVNLDKCAEISQELSLYFDVNPPVSDETYRLEVSSPGIERKLTTKNHFKSSIGEKVKLKIINDGKYIGILKSADDKGIVVDIQGESKRVEYSQINKARTYFEW